MALGVYQLIPSGAGVVEGTGVHLVFEIIYIPADDESGDGDDQ